MPIKYSIGSDVTDRNYTRTGFNTRVDLCKHANRTSAKFAFRALAQNLGNAVVEQKQCPFPVGIHKITNRTITEAYLNL